MQIVQLNKTLLGRFCVLLVEDDETVLNVLYKQINNHAKQTYKALNGKEGLKIYEQHKPDIIISDIKMPEMNGIEMTEKIKAINSQAIIIIVSAFSDSKQLSEAIDVGVDGYLIKPLDRSLFYKTLNKTMQALYEKQESIKKLLDASKERAVTQTVSTLAHQWRQPLCEITMNANLARMDIENSSNGCDELIELFENISNTTLKLSKTIDTLALYSLKTEEYASIDLYDEIERISLLFDDVIKSSNVELILDIHQGCTLVLCKSTLFEILEPLITNALEAHRRNKTSKAFIKISAFEENHHIHIIIEDNAGGIDESIEQNIFGFYSSSKESLNESGLGLFLVKYVVQNKLKGTIEVKNCDEGACITIILNRLQ